MAVSVLNENLTFSGDLPVIATRNEFYKEIKDKNMDEAAVIQYVKSHNLSFLHVGEILKIRKATPIKTRKSREDTQARREERVHSLTRSLTILASLPNEEKIIFTTSKNHTRPGSCNECSLYQSQCKPGDEPCSQSWLGEGSKKTVWRVKNLATGKDLAVSLIIDRYDFELWGVKAEYENSQKIQSPYILKLQSYGIRSSDKYRTGAAQGYAVSELCKSTLESLSHEELQRHPEYQTQIELAYQAAHNAGIIHRDGRPDNVFIDMQGNIRLGDFGESRALAPQLIPEPNTPWEKLSREQQKALMTDKQDLENLKQFLRHH